MSKPNSADFNRGEGYQAKGETYVGIVVEHHLPQAKFCSSTMVARSSFCILSTIEQTRSEIHPLEFWRLSTSMDG